MQSSLIKRLITEAPALAAVCGAFFLCSLALSHLILPGWQNVRHNIARVNHYSSFIATSEDQDQVKQILEEKNAQLQKKLLDSFSFNNPHTLSEALEILIDYASRADISFVKMEPQADTRTSNYIIHPVLLEANTDYHNLGQFMASLENMPETFRTERLGVDVTDRNVLNVRLLINAYLSGDDQEAE